MASVTLEIPDDVLVKLTNRNRDAEYELRLAAAFTLCSAGDLSTSQAARLAGMTYGGFLEAAARAKVMVYPVDIEEFKEEIGRGFTLGGAPGAASNALRPRRLLRRSPIAFSQGKSIIPSRNGNLGRIFRMNKSSADTISHGSCSAKARNRQS